MELPLRDMVQVVARAVIPIVGILFLGWSMGNVVFVYCADVLASVYAVCVLACGRLFAMEPVGSPAWWQRLTLPPARERRWRAVLTWRFRNRRRDAA